MGNNRVDWVDIYKSIAIIFMIMGHSNMGVMVQYVYEFHMAAFFFISGFTFNIIKKTTVRTIYDKTLGLIIPYLTIFFLLLIVVNFLDYLGYYNLFFEAPLPSISTGVSTFFVYGDSHVLWLGAGWFITVLFGVFIFQKLSFSALGKRISWVYGFVSFMFFLIGYFLINNDIRPKLWFLQLDLICVGQFYFYLGIFLKEKKYLSYFREKKNVSLLLMYAFSIIGIWFFYKILPTTVDYPTRKFNNPFQDILVAFNGIIFCFISSIFLEMFPKKINRIFVYVGKNTFSIVVFHFMIFDLIFWVLYKLRKKQEFK